MVDTPCKSTVHVGLEVVLAHFIHEFMRFMKKQGLSSTQIHALMYIYHTGECQISDIGAIADASNAAASQLVERLVQQGLVERREDPANRRTKILNLTEKGKELIRDSILSNRSLIEIMASLTPVQRQAVQNTIELLAEAVRQIPASNQPKDGYHA